MASSSDSLHERYEDLSPETIDRHRAIVSLMEEMEAVDWYDQRLEATHDPALRDLLIHNRDEEKEHAAMVLEWLRRKDPVWNEMLGRFLFTEGDILAIEEELEGAEAEAGSTPAGDGSLGIGSLKGKRA